MANSVLLVDDDHTFREKLAVLLWEEGISASTVSSSTEAIQAIKKHSYPVAVIDILMPGMDGISLLREVRNINPATNVIMIADGGMTQTAAEAIRLGACDYLIKPVPLEQILSKIKQLLPTENKNVKSSVPQDNQKIPDPRLDTENLREATKEFERKYISNVLERCRYDKVVTAKLLGVGLSSLYRKIEELNISVENKSEKKVASISDLTP